MPTYHLRLVVQAGPEPIDGETLPHDEDTLTIEAPSLRQAHDLALMRTRVRALGRQIHIYDADSGDPYVAPPPTGFQPARFVIDGLPGTYRGFTRGQTWNGFAVPYFPLAEAHRVADDYAAQPPSPDGQTLAHYDADRDLIRLYDPSSGEWDEYAPVVVDGHALYPIGSHYWTWEEVAAAPEDAA